MYMMASVMKPSPRGLLMWANCCWARGLRLDRDRCKSASSTDHVAGSWPVCLCLCDQCLCERVLASVCLRGNRWSP